jgi:aspartate-semialdehyde dehydrogenase
VGGRWEYPAAGPPPDLPLLPACPGEFEADVVFSALETAAAAETEPLFREAGLPVVTNASALRMDPEVPLVIPEINAAHLHLADLQRRRFGGFVAANPNCSTIGLCLALEPIRRAFGLRRASVTTLQAASGAGYPGVPSLDLVDNVLPFIRGEEEKLETEPQKIWGSRRASLDLRARCNRVPVRDGHLLCVEVETRRALSEESAREAFARWRSPLSDLGLPSAPERPVLLRSEEDRPQPLFDRDAAAGMAVTVGRLRPRPPRGLAFTALVHNTMRGAAGGTLLLAELLAATGRLERAKGREAPPATRRGIRAADPLRSAT